MSSSAFRSAALRTRPRSASPHPQHGQLGTSTCAAESPTANSVRHRRAPRTPRSREPDTHRERGAGDTSRMRNELRGRIRSIADDHHTSGHLLVAKTTTQIRQLRHDETLPARVEPSRWPHSIRAMSCRVAKNHNTTAEESNSPLASRDCTTNDAYPARHEPTRRTPTPVRDDISRSPAGRPVQDCVSRSGPPARYTAGMETTTPGTTSNDNTRAHERPAGIAEIVPRGDPSPLCEGGTGRVY